MLDLIDDSLEAFFRATVPLSAQDVDVSFEAPERDWSAKLTRPTVSLFLWDIRRSQDRARTGVEEVQREGRLVRRMALPRIELRYLVTAWTSDHGDERALLGGLMRAVLGHGKIPEQFLAESLRADAPLTMLMARASDEQADVSKILDGQLKPGISITIVAPVDTDVYTPAGPPVEVFEARIGLIGGASDGDGVDPALMVRRIAGEVADPAAVGASVISPRGTTTVNLAGRFVIPARAGDELVIETAPPLTVVVPLEGGVRVG